MKVTLNWLRDFVDIDVDVQTLCDKLVSIGFEVEDVIFQNEHLQNIVVGQIKTLTKHPDADKLQICGIDIGGQQLQVVTGASNVQAGDFVPVALENALMSGGVKIKKGKLRGVLSEGMLCSGHELQITEAQYPGASVDGILILQDGAKPGSPIADVIGQNDVVLDVAVTANRPDCNSVLGLAREVAAVLGKKIKLPDLSYQTDKRKKVDNFLKVTLKDSDLCPRYMAAIVNDVKIMPAPKEISARLEAVGLKSINNIVDFTNYVLMEIGQPMHAFDYSCLNGAEIVVRRAKQSEKITTLDGKEHSLDTEILAICDAEAPCAIGGVMGGEQSGIKDSTTQVVLESAMFKRDNIRKTARKLNLHTDAAARYEKGIDFQSQEIGLRRMMHLICRYQAGTIAENILDASVAIPGEKILSFKSEKICSILGIDIDDAMILKILNDLGIKTTAKNGTMTSIIPVYRQDLENSNDIAEEIIRFYGYDNIVGRSIDVGAQTLGGKDFVQRSDALISDYLRFNGFFECLTYSFTTPKMFDALNIDDKSSLRDVIRLQNPLGEDLSVMRTDLAYNMLKTVASNVHKNNKSGRLFEMANVYLKKEGQELPDEVRHLALATFGEGEDYYKIKANLENIGALFGCKFQYKRSKTEYLHPGKSADILIDNEKIGHFGQINPFAADRLDLPASVFYADIRLGALTQNGKQNQQFSEIAKFPSTVRDLAVLVDQDILAADMISLIKKAGGKMLSQIEVFDVYQGAQVADGKKSMAFKLEFNLLERTLTDEEVNDKMNKILKKLEQECKAVLR